MAAEGEGETGHDSRAEIPDVLYDAQSSGAGAKLDPRGGCHVGAGFQTFDGMPRPEFRRRRAEFLRESEYRENEVIRFLREIRDELRARGAERQREAERQRDAVEEGCDPKTATRGELFDASVRSIMNALRESIRQATEEGRFRASLRIDEPATPDDERILHRIRSAAEWKFRNIPVDVRRDGDRIEVGASWGPCSAKRDDLPKLAPVYDGPISQ